MSRRSAIRSREGPAVATTLSSAIHSEHQKLLGQVSELTALVANDPPDRERIRATSAALRRQLACHMALEERSLYPAYERVTGTDRAAASLVADHRDILRRLDRLSAPSTELGQSELNLVEGVWGVAAIVRMHLDKEEDLLLAELDRRLTPVEAAALLHTLQPDLPLAERLGPTEAILYNHVQDHLRNEQFAIDGYQRITARFDRSSYVGYLVAMILEDERRHHQLFSDLLASIEQRDSATPPAVPEVRPLPELAELREQLEQYLGFEQQDRTELASLARSLRSERDRSLWPVLVEIMRRDTDKHIHILQFLCRNATTPPRHRGSHCFGKRAG
jgi:bacterioferritin (cytochrome b1)/hemerythrin-like domain-containing protein